MLGLGLSGADITALENRTEGWVVGLQLAGLSIRNRVNPSAFIAGLNGSHRYILSYLTEEVLSGQPVEVQDFLLQTALLERMSGDLCNAVTGRTDSAAMLEHLLSANLFLIPLDDEQRWYRYHHLFADLLRDRLRTTQAGRAIEIQRLASRWFAAAGMPGEAIKYALAAGDHEMAVDLIENHAVEMLIQGYAKTVETWLAAIPGQVRFQSPKTNLAFAWMYLLQGSPERIFPFMERLQAVFASNPPASASLQAEWLALQAYLLGAQGKPDESLALAGQALEIAPEADAYVRSLTFHAMGMAYAFNDDYPQALDVYQKAILHGQAAGNFVAEMLARAILTQITLQHGQYQAAFEAASQGVQRAESAGVNAPICAAFYGGLGQVYYEWRQPEKAQLYFQRAIQLSALVGYSDAEIGYAVICSRQLLALGRLADAMLEMQKALDLLRADAPAWTREDVVCQQVRVSLAQHDPAAAELALGKLLQEPAAPQALPPKMGYSARLLYNSVLRIRLYQAVTRRGLDDVHQGLELADTLIDGALRGQYLSIAVEALLLRAQLKAAINDAQASRVDLVRALELAGPEGFISLFVEEGPVVASGLADLLRQGPASARRSAEIEKILAAFPGHQPQAGAPVQNQPTPQGFDISPLQPLSARELEILQLICMGCSNQEIAGRLVLSPHTVKKHTSNVFAKLGVTSRTQAAARARQLKLL
jgi:LuxR family maltose regulon positive regulatory protein